MGPIENIDILINIMAESEFMKKLCLAYDKKRRFKYKFKENSRKNMETSKSTFFNESEECLKILGFLAEKSVENLNGKLEFVCQDRKEFNSDGDIKDCIDMTRNSCKKSDSFCERRQNRQHISCNFSSESLTFASCENCVPSDPIRRKFISRKSDKRLKSLSSVSSSSESSEDETKLTQNCTSNECKPISSRIKEENTGAKDKTSEISNGSAVFINNKSKCKVIVQNAYNSPKKKISKRKRKEYSVISYSEGTFANEDGNKKKSTEGNILCIAQARKNNLPKTFKIKPDSGPVPLYSYGEQDIVTISSDSSTDSDEDILKQVYYENTEEFKVKATEREIFKAQVSSEKAVNISEANITDEVSLLDYHNLSKCDSSAIVKEPNCCEMVSAKDLFIFEQNNQINNIKEPEKSAFIHRKRAKVVTERKTKLKMTRNKTFRPTICGENSDCSFINNHTNNLSNVSCKSNSYVVSYESDNTSDDGVVFEGVYKSVYPDANNKRKTESSKNKAKAQKFVKQNDLENIEKAFKLSNATDDDKNVRNQSLLVSTGSCIRNGEFQSNEIRIETKFGKEMFIVDSNPSKLSEANERLKRKFDFVPEPVDFEIPPLHEKEQVGNPSKEDLARWAKQGVKITKGKYTPEEDEILKRNFMEFCKEYGIWDPFMIFGIHSDKKIDRSVLRFLRAKKFYVRLGKDLNDRKLISVYNRARVIFHPYASNKKWSSEEVSKLIHLYKRFGTNWNTISKLLKKPSDYCHTHIKDLKEKYGSAFLNKKKHE